MAAVAAVSQFQIVNLSTPGTYRIDVQVSVAEHYAETERLRLFDVKKQRLRIL